MDIKSAFYWDVKANSISFLICKIGKDQFEILSAPDNFIIKSKKPDEFYSESQGVIKSYFNEIKSITPRPEKIDIEYRILHSGAPAHVFNLEFLYERYLNTQTSKYKGLL
ncbi:hypothetical protein [Legionella resiliens]|uniref:Uncharacterized protein n=1 Tax=Legionella resiliens TaxID=2905958 RepID=A0ABS8X1Y0_9GAMM|nr:MULTISPECIES: hypothetical protein [unclassified Legionella]MCE0723587.1 hypothetical protein [Legionella sp. 9fVS26]MCE3532741.1 hypothetical protein [Legionella sp. 8cVS16]